MRIAIILPSLAHKAPILVARDIVSQIYDKVDCVDVYYFDDIVEVDFKCPVFHLKFSESIDFDKYDIVHSHLYRPDKYIWKNRKKIKAKVVSTIHCNIAKDLRHSYNFLISLIFRWVWILYIRSADKAVALTKSAVKEQYEKYFPTSKLTYIYNGRTIADVEPVSENDESEILKFKNAGLRIIGSNAIISKRKGLHFIVETLPLLPNYAFVVVGDGVDKDSLIKQAKQLGVYDRCLFLGFKNNAEAYLPFYDVYAMPSLSEGFGLALVEATLKKRSCICSDLTSFHEMFSPDEVTFFSTWSVDSLKTAIENAFINRVQKGENAYARSMRNYTAEVMGASYLNLYKSMLTEK